MKSSKPRKPLRRHQRMPRGTKPMAKRNAKRRTSEFARCYGSRERVAWVKSLPCVCCTALHPIFAIGRGLSENAHTVTDGMGRKADYDTIIPLCSSHHRRYDQHQTPFDTEPARDAAKAYAAVVEASWRARQGDAA